MNINLEERLRLRKLGLGVSPFQEAGVTGVDFAYLRENHIVLHQFMHLDLTVARTNVKFVVEGTSLQVVNLTSGGQIQISFNKPNEPIPFSGAEQWESAFYEIYVTNTAQVATSCDLVIMVNGRFTPYYKTKAISPVVSNTPTVLEFTLTLANTAYKILASNILRRTVYLQSVLGNVDIIYLDCDATVAVNKSFPLYIGGQNQYLEPYYTGDIYGISAVAGQKIRVWANYE